MNPAALPDAPGYNHLRSLATLKIAADGYHVRAAIRKDVQLLDGVSRVVMKHLVALDKVHERRDTGREEEIDLRAVMPAAVWGLVSAGERARGNLLARAIGLSEIAALVRKWDEAEQSDNSSRGGVEHGMSV